MQVKKRLASIAFGLAAMASQSAAACPSEVTLSINSSN